jgi:SulP family sulfate permease
VARTRAEQKLLIDLGKRQFILLLQGFIFFGTANSLLVQLRQRVDDPDQVKPDFIVLDFRRVTGLDSTGMLRFQRMRQLAENEDIVLVFTEPKDRVLHQLHQGGFVDDGRHVRIFTSLDMGVAWCEDRLLMECRDRVNQTVSLEASLRQLLSIEQGNQRLESRLSSLMSHFERVQIDAGQVLIKLGDLADDLYFIDSGQVTARLDRPGLPPIRLETAGSGSVIGEIGFYLGGERTADVIADTPCILYRMRLNDLQRLEETDPETASTLHRVIVLLLAERIVNMTNSLKTLEG